MRRAPFLPHCRGLQRRFASAQSQLDADVVVIGAGVVGLAIARELGLAGRQVLVLDSGPAIGTQTSSRNSEVIHSGIYYPPGSLKAQTCVEGNALMYKFCEQYNVPVRRTGKLLVATSDQQLDQLESTRRSAAANGVELERLTPGEIRELEPEVQAVAGLLAPNTGIVDSHSLMTELQRQIEEAGGMVALHSTVEGGEVGGATKRLADLRGCGQRRRPLGAACLALPARGGSAPRPPPGPGQGLLLCAERVQAPVPPPRLPGALRGRAGRAPDPGPGGGGQVRPRHLLAAAGDRPRRPGLRRRPGPAAGLPGRRPGLLAGAAGRGAAAGVCGRAAQGRRPRPAGGGLSGVWTRGHGRAGRGRAVRHRVPGPDGLAGPWQEGRGAAGWEVRAPRRAWRACA
ncbi:hypothetical protein ACKKBF_B09645 [Auxenochlorella protothecoides x Auxenochlorella symbiontica]